MFTGLESPIHLIIVLVIVLLFFGGKRLPELAKGLGSGMREFKKSAAGAYEGDEEEEEKSRQALEAKAHEEQEEQPEGAEHPEDAATRDKRET